MAEYVVSTALRVGSMALYYCVLGHAILKSAKYRGVSTWLSLGWAFLIMPPTSGALYEYEVRWRDHYNFLKEKGYTLRSRYSPDWVPSWTNSNKVPINCEDGVPSPVSKMCTTDSNVDEQIFSTMIYWMRGVLTTGLVYH